MCIHPLCFQLGSACWLEDWVAASGHRRSLQRLMVCLVFDQVIPNTVSVEKYKFLLAL